MAKLTFDWDAKRNVSVAYVPGFRVTVEQDSDACNPWKDMDCLPPLTAYSDRTLTQYGDWSETDAIAIMSDSFINRHWRELCDIFDMPESEARDLKSAYRYDCSIAEVKRDLLNQWLGGESGQARVNLLRDLFNLIGWPTYSTTSRGYSQGDWAELMLVYTPAHAAACGIKFPRSAKAKAAALRDLESSAELWGNWAWGNVYGAVIEAWDGEKVIGDPLESCWGFYGNDFDESGLAEYAESEIAAIRRQWKAKRTAKLKELIRARVPVAIRADILKGFPL